jgi:NhaP-type Na+/H+ or K+/H+ antiporter
VRPEIAWFLVVGGVFVLMALAGSVLRRLPLTSAILYLVVGAALAALGLLRLDPLRDSRLLEHLTEIAVIVSLFSAGLKLRIPFRDERWRAPLALASISMALTVAMVAVAGVSLLGLSLGAAILLGAVLAPTDPVLASDVQVERAGDRDRLRFSLTGEAGLNDGTAFPFVMLGLGLLGAHELGSGGLRWVLVDVVWASAGGLLIGGVLGTLVARLVLYLRAHHREAVGLDDFLALGLIALAYGAALAASTYGFLAVFAAGLALRRVERESTGPDAPDDIRAEAHANEEVITAPETAPAYMAEAVLGFNEQLERIAEVSVVVVIGALLLTVGLPWEVAWFAPLLFLVIRPVAVLLGLLGSRTRPAQRTFIAWFGIRGVGSIYYLMFAISHGLPEPDARRLTAVVLVVVAISIVVHGVSVTPLMERYGGLRAAWDRDRERAGPAEERG